MTDTVTLGNTAWRDWATDGVASSGAHKPLKSEIRAFVAQLGKQASLKPTTTGARGTDMAIATEQWATGTVTGPTTLNHFKVWADDINAANSGGTDYFVAAFTFDNYFGGSNARGGRTGVAVHQYLTAATNAASDNRNYTALSGVMTALAGDGGTDPASATTSRGALFGAGLVAVAHSGATALLNVTGCEFNVAMQTGSSAWAKSLAQFSARSDDAVAGTVIDAMLWLYNQVPGGPKWKHGILFEDSGGYGAFPFDTNSTVLAVTGPGGSTIGTGIDFNDVIITGNAFQCQSFSFGTGGSGNGFLEMGGVSKTPLIDFHSGASLIDYDSRISASGGTGVVGQGSLNFTAAVTTLSGTLQFVSKSIVSSPTDGNLLLTNAAGTGFGLLQLGGTTSSFPALKRSSATLEVKLADDSGYASITGANYRSVTSMFAQATGTIGSVGLVSGDGTRAGYIEWRTPSALPSGGTRLGYLGYSAANILLTLENSANFFVNGGSSRFGSLTAPAEILDVTGNVGVSGVYKVGGVQVVGARDTGWTPMTGTANENTAYDTASVTLPQLAGRVMALQAALTTHGLIGT